MTKVTETAPPPRPGRRKGAEARGGGELPHALAWTAVSRVFVHRACWGTSSILIACVATALLGGEALAQDTVRDPADLIEQQSTQDVTAIPRGRGAVLVPTLSGGKLEPQVAVYADGTRVAFGRTGSRIVLPPGRYVVRVGQGADAARPQTTVDVREGETTTVAPFFGAIRVQVVNRADEPIKRSYVLESLDRGTTYGPVITNPSEDGPPPATWLVPAGRYKLVLGTDPDASEGAVSFTLHPSELLRYRLVAHRGALLRADLAEDDLQLEPSIWRLRWVVGGSLAFDSRNTQLLHEGRMFLLGSLFNQLEAGIDTGPHLALLTINANQSVAWLDSEYGADIPIRNLESWAEAELLYTLRAGRIFGPYARAKGSTSYLEQHYIPGEFTTIDTFDEAGNIVDQTEVDAFDRVRLYRAGSPVILQQGVGVSLTPVDDEVGDFGVRAGGSARQAFYRDSRFVDDQVGNNLQLVRIDDRKELGGEITARAGVHVGSVLDVNTRFDSFFPSKIFTGDVDAERFPFRWRSSASLGVTDYLATTYSFLLARDEVVIDKLQMVHGVSVTLQATLF